MISKANGITNQEACYSSLSSGFKVVSDLNSSPIDLNDRQTQQFFVNLCGFYHEKLGNWITIGDIPNLDPQLIQEFYSQYKNTIPESVINFWQITN
jgi:hypothetical protein